MDITLRTWNKNKMFGELNPGDVFIHNKQVYMKVMPRARINAIRLPDGDYCRFGMGDSAEPAANVGIFMEFMR